MDTKPPSKPLPKLVMKEWPEPELIGEVQSLAKHLRDDDKPYSADVAERAAKALSDFTRVVEETGILDQEEAHRRKQESKHD